MNPTRIECNEINNFWIIITVIRLILSIIETIAEIILIIEGIGEKNR